MRDDADSQAAGDPPGEDPPARREEAESPDAPAAVGSEGEGAARQDPTEAATEDALTPADEAEREREAVDATALHLRRRALRDRWLRQAGTLCTLLLVALAGLVLGARQATGDAGWVPHLAWLAWTLPVVAWLLHRSAERNTASLDRFRTNVERDLRRRDERPRPLPPDPPPASGAPMLALGAGALLVVLAGSVPVERPKLDGAAVSISHLALEVEAKAEALAEAGVVSAERVLEVQQQARELASAPRSLQEAEEHEQALDAIERQLRQDARRSAREAGDRLSVAEVASALAAAIDPQLPGRASAPAAGPGGLPGGATASLVALSEEALAGPAGPSGSRRLSLPPALRDALHAADRDGRPPSAEELRETTALLRDRRDQLGQLLQRLSEAGFPLSDTPAASAAGDPVDPAALAALLRRTGRVDPAAVKAAAARSR